MYCRRAAARISDAWLQEKNTREKGFSLGSFDEKYLLHFPVAIVKRQELDHRLRQPVAGSKQAGTVA